MPVPVSPGPPSGHGRARALRRLVVGILLVLVGIGMLVPAPSARATTGVGPASGIPWGATGQLWVGSYRLSDGSIAWCAFDPRQASPLQVAQVDWGEWTDLSGEYRTGAGTVLDAATVARVAYVLGTWGATEDAGRAVAVYRILHTHVGVEYAAGVGFEEATAPQTALADSMWEEAGRYRGPYTLDAPGIAVRESGTAATAAIGPVRSATGAVPPARLRATISGPAVWEQTGTGAVDLANGRHELAIRATGNGPVSVQVAADLPADHLRVAQPDGDAQRLALGGLRAPVTAASPEAPLAATFQPRAASRAHSYVVGDGAGPSVGERLRDEIDAFAAPGDTWFSFTSGERPGAVSVRYRIDWWFSRDPLPQSAQAPATAERFDTTWLDAAGPGTHTVQSERPADQAGFYYPVVSVARAEQPGGERSVRDLITADWTAPFHDEGEEAVVPWTPQISTRTGTIVNGAITDRITVRGTRPDEPIEVVSTLMASRERPQAEGVAEAPADAEALASVTTAFTGDGTQETRPVPIPWERFLAEPTWPTLYWVERIEPSAHQRAWTGRHLLPDESVVLERPRATTTAGAGGTVPVEVADTAEVFGTIPAGSTIRTELGFELYRFDENGTPKCEAPVWSEPKPISVGAPGRYESSATRLADAGTYGFVETLTAVRTTETGEERTVLDRGACGAPGETVIAAAMALPVTGAAWAPIGGAAALIAAGAAGAAVHRAVRGGRGR
ncbi:MAG: hypothetical protein ABF811_01205 [Pseudoclavibacter sp.]